MGAREKDRKNRIERSWGLGERKRRRQRQIITTPVDAAVCIDPLLLCGGGATKHRCQWANARSGICGTSPGGQVLHCVLQQTPHLLQHWITCIPLVQGLRNGWGHFWALCWLTRPSRAWQMPLMQWMRPSRGGVGEFYSGARLCKEDSQQGLLLVWLVASGGACSPPLYQRFTITHPKTLLLLILARGEECCFCRVWLSCGYNLLPQPRLPLLRREKIG